MVSFDFGIKGLKVKVTDVYFFCCFFLFQSSDKLFNRRRILISRFFLCFFFFLKTLFGFTGKLSKWTSLQRILLSTDCGCQTHFKIILKIIYIRQSFTRLCQHNFMLTTLRSCSIKETVKKGPKKLNEPQITKKMHRTTFLILY